MKQPPQHLRPSIIANIDRIRNTAYYRALTPQHPIRSKLSSFRRFVTTGKKWNQP